MARSVFARGKIAIGALDPTGAILPRKERLANTLWVRSAR
jgi:hypothetical protein